MNKQEIDKAIEILNYYTPIGAINAGFKPKEEEIHEDTKAFNLAISALEKQIPKKPIKEEKQYSEDYGFNGDILCPVCNNYIGYYTEAMCKPEYMQYCNECGQRIDDNWRVEE